MPAFRLDVQVLPEILDSAVDNRPIVRADALKFICVFRSHLPGDFLLQVLAPLIAHLSSQHVVVQTYAAYTIERYVSYWNG
jgi:exportin-2 (importin alpha re-exporter)